MKIVYDVTLDHMIEFQYYHTLNSPAGQKMQKEGQWWQSTLFLGFGLGAAWALLDTFWFWNAAVPVIVVAAYMFHRRFPQRAEKRIREYARALVMDGDNIGILGRHEMTLTADGIEEKTEAGDQENDWGSIDRIVTRGDATYIYTGPLLAHILPKKGVVEGHYQLFVTALLKEHHAYLGQAAIP